MNTKTKILFGVVSLICLLSIVFNGILLLQSNSPARNVNSQNDSVVKTQEEFSSYKRKLDSLANQVKEHINNVPAISKVKVDSLINEMLQLNLGEENRNE